MPQWKAGGYVIRQYATDHDPPHVHVYRDRALVAKVTIPDGLFMFLANGKHRARILRALRDVHLVD
jgi:hypothetical protein